MSVVKKKITDAVPSTERTSSVLVDISTIELSDPDSEGAQSSWIHAMELATFKHPLWGKIEFTPERMQRFAENVNNRIREVDLAVDFSHESGKEAAGWIKTAEARPNGLWLFVEWTKDAAQKIRDKAYRYFSPEFVDEWQNPKTQQKFKDVVLGGGLTNRPFQKGLVPVNLSEFFSGGEPDPNNDKEEEVTLDEFLAQARTTLQLSESATAEEILKKMTEKPSVKGTSSEEIQRLVEENPTVKSLVEDLTATKAALKLSEVNSKMRDWSEGKKFAIPPAITDELRKILLEAPKSLSEDLDKVFTHIAENGLVELEEKGGRRPAKNEGGKSAKVLMDEAVTKLMSEDSKLGYADAFSEASRDEELYERYRQELFDGEHDQEEAR